MLSLPLFSLLYYFIFLMKKDKCFFTCISLLLHQPLARRASQTGATFNYLLVNRPPDTCKNKAGVRGAGAVSLPAPHSTPHDPALGLPRSRRGQAGPELPEERRGEEGRAGPGRAGPGQGVRGAASGLPGRPQGTKGSFFAHLPGHFSKD